MSKIGARMKISSYRTYVRNSLSLNWIRSYAREILPEEKRFWKKRKIFSKRKEEKNIFKREEEKYFYKPNWGWNGIFQKIVVQNIKGNMVFNLILRTGSSTGRSCTRRSHRWAISFNLDIVGIGCGVGSSWTRCCNRSGISLLISQIRVSHRYDTAGVGWYIGTCINRCCNRPRQNRVGFRL